MRLVLGDNDWILRPGEVAPLTAPQMLDFADVAGVLTNTTGRTIARVVLGG